MGQRQLVSVARAVITRPNLLLADEPTSNMDGKIARRLMHLFTQLCRLGTTVVLSTHSEDLVERYPHPVLHLAQGRLTRAAAAALGTGGGRLRRQGMNLRRFDLPLRHGAASRFLPWTIGGLLYLAVVALAVAAIADEALRRYDLRRELVTVTLPSVEDGRAGEQQGGAGDRSPAPDARGHLGGCGAARGTESPGRALARQRPTATWICRCPG